MSTELKSLVLNAVSGFVLCTILGLFFYGTFIFKFHYSCSIIVTDGFFGAIFFSVLKYRETKEQVLTGFALLLLNILIPGRSINLIYFIQTILLVAAIIGAIKCYKLFLDKYNTYPLFIRSLALPVFLGVFNTFIVLILVIYYHAEEMMIYKAILKELKFSVCTGIGLGVGFDLFEKFKSNIIKVSK